MPRLVRPGLRLYLACFVITAAMAAARGIVPALALAPPAAGPGSEFPLPGDERPAQTGEGDGCTIISAGRLATTDGSVIASQ